MSRRADGIRQGNWFSINHRQLRVCLWIFLTLSVFYIGLTRGRFISTDEVQVYQATRSLWENGNVAIGSPEGFRGRGGLRYAVANSGLPVASLPLYGVGKLVESVCLHGGKQNWLNIIAGPVVERRGGDRWSGEAGIFFVNLFNCFATALLVALFYCFSLELGTSSKWALCSAGLLAFTSYLAPFSGGFFQHSTEALFLFAAFFFLFRDQRRPDWKWRLLAGISTALLIQFRFPAVVALPGLMVYHGVVLWRRSRWTGILREAAPFVAALAGGFVLHALDQYAKFGTIWSVGTYANLREHNPLLVGLYAFLFSPGDSLFLFTPVLILAPWALGNLYRRYPAAVGFILLETGFYLFFYSKFDDWHGLWCFGPRYLVALVPLLLLPLGPWLQAASFRQRLLVIPFALCGAWIQAIHFTADYWSVAAHENYLSFQPPRGFLFLPAASQVVAHSRAMLAWDSRVDIWLVTVYRGLGMTRFLCAFLVLLFLLVACVWKLRLSLRALSLPPSPAEPSTERWPGFFTRLITRRFRRLAVVGLVLLLFIPYSNHFYNSFHFDDAHTIQNNVLIRSLGNIPQFFRDATTFSSLPSNQSYRPLVSTMLAIDYWFGNGLWPFWFHLSIFLLYGALVVLFALVVHRILESVRPSPWNRWIALCAAAAYGVHPANADTVNYVIASSDVISTFGVIASFAVYFLFPRQRRYYLFALPAAVCILAKPPAIVFPVLFAVYRLLFPELADDSLPKRRTGKYCLEVVPPFLICAAVLVFVQYMTPRSWVAGSMNSFGYLITQPYVALEYFRTFLWPSQLSADYDLNPFSGMHDSRFWIGAAFGVVLVGAALAFSFSRRTRVVGFGLLWFVIGLLPTSLFPLAEVMNDHRTFLPYLGLVIALAGAVALVVERFPLRTLFSRGVVAAGVVCLLGASAYATFQRNKVWSSEETLWRDVTQKSPHNGRGLMNYGLTVMARGQYTEALDYFHRAEVFTPQYPILFVNLAIAENAIDQADVAEQHFRDALRLAPGSPDVYTYYARFLIQHARQAEAQPLLHTAAGLSPNDELIRDLTAEASLFSAETYLNQSLQFYGEHKFAESLSAAQKALELRPGYAEAWNNIGVAYNELGQFEKAASACEEALRLKPDFELARNNLKYAREKLQESRPNGYK